MLILFNEENKMDRRKTDRRNIPNNTDIYIPDLTEIMRILYKRKLLIAVITIAPILLTVLYLKFMPNKYQATTSIIIEDQNINMAEFQDILEGMKFDNLTVPTQVNVINSSDLLRQTIETLHLQENSEGELTLPSDNTQSTTAKEYDLIKKFQENLKVGQQGTSRIIDISFTSSDPEVAAIIANAHAKQYMYSLTQQKKQQAESLDKWLSEKIIQLKRETLEKSKAVQQFRVESGMVLGRNSQELVYQQITDIASQLSPIEAKELDLKARMETLSAPASQITEVVESDLIQKLKSSLSETSQKLQSLRSDYGPNHPEVISLHKQVAQITSDIQRETANIKKSIFNELNTVTMQKKLLNEKLSLLQKQADSFEEKQITMQSLQIEESASRKSLDNFLARSEEIKSRIDFTRPNARIVSPANVPGEPLKSKKILILMAMAILSGLVAICVVFALELVDNGIEDKDQIKKLLNLKLLASLPEEHDPLARIDDKERSSYLEEIKRIYIHISSNPNTKSILFTSAQKGEGKSMVVIAIAKYLNSIGKNVLVIDADTINPKIADLIFLPNKPGFYELMAHEKTLNDVIVKSKSGFHCIPSGDKNPYVSDLLLSGRFNDPLAKVCESYDFVLIDSSPAPEVSDVEVLCGLVDEVVLVTAWAKTPRKHIKNASEIIRQFSKNAPSIILNKVKLSA